MPTYEYEALNSRGQATEGTITAADKDEAIRKIRMSGLFPTKCKGLGGRQARLRQKIASGNDSLADKLETLKKLMASPGVKKTADQADMMALITLVATLGAITAIPIAVGMLVAAGWGWLTFGVMAFLVMQGGNASLNTLLGKNKPPETGIDPGETEIEETDAEETEEEK